MTAHDLSPEPGDFENSARDPDGSSVSPVDSASRARARNAAICITTFRRPLGLRRLLEAIAQLEIPEGWEFDVVVIDNDSAQSGRAVVEAITDLSVRYVVEATRGIPQARNRALNETRGCSWVAFLDDDEWPETTWWRRLVEVQTQTRADVVIGPSEPVFEADPPGWIREGHFFDRERFATGTRVPFWLARTSGVLIHRRCFEFLGSHPFDERIPLAGGEDRMFFEKVHRSGATILWVDDAIVKECVPATRSNARWVLLRSFRTGNTRGITLVLQNASLARRSMRAIRGVVDFGIGFAALVRARDRAERMNGLARIALGFGLTAGSLGFRYDEYAVTHGG